MRQAFIQFARSSRPRFSPRDSVTNSDHSNKGRRNPYANSNPSEKVQAVDEFLTAHNAIEIYIPNDTSEFSNDAKAVKEVYLYYLELLRQRGISNPAAFLKGLRIQFSVTRELGLSSYEPNQKAWTYHRPGQFQSTQYGSGAFGWQEHIDIPALDWRSVVYPVEKIEAMLKADMKADLIKSNLKISRTLKETILTNTQFLIP
jgi:hypothetical protein